MNTLNWYFPKSMPEAVLLLQQQKGIPHAGGTGLLMGNLGRINGLIDLSRLALRYVKIENDTIAIGSMSTYADVLAALQAKAPDHILVKSLRHAAHTPLRNRITIGGSLSCFPPWSDLIGALITLDAEIILVGGPNDTIAIEDYLDNNKLQKNTLIEAVKFKLADWRTAHYRAVRTKSDLPAFTITTMLKIDNNKVTDARIIVVGTVKKYQRLLSVEEYLKNRETGKVNSQEIISRVELKMAGRRILDPGYANYKAAVKLARGINQLIGSD